LGKPIPMDLLPKLPCPRIFVFCINWESSAILRPDYSRV
jgi:hypothetical protein